MKIALLVALCSLFLHTWASPILTVDSTHQEIAPVSSPNQQETARRDSGTPSVPSPSEQESARQDSGTVPVVPAPAADSDDDDDDDDDDVDLDITDDDDDDDEDSEDAEEDDDDEDYFERFFDDILGDEDDDDDDEDEAPPAPVPAVQTPAVSASPASKPTVASVDYSSLDYTGPGSLETSNNNGVPPVLIAKYNRFTDNIMERINKILRKNYDPVNVRLQSNNNNNNKNNNNNNKNNNNNNSSKNKNKNKHKNRRNRPGSNKKGNKRSGHHRSVNVNQYEKDSAESRVNESFAAISAQLTDGVPHVTLAAYNTTEISSTHSGVMATTTEVSTTKRSDSGNRKRPNHQHRKNNSNKSKNKIRARDRPTAKATLYGLSSIRREGDVTVNMMSSHTTVKTRFTVGPLILKVEKEFGRGAKKDIRSATATTTELVGKMNLRVLHGGAATLHSIRVMQPKQVRVESSDDHDKTREYVWKRSSHIAHVVSQKLTNATKSMLQPPPIQTVTTYSSYFG